MKEKREKVTFYLNPNVSKFLKECKNKTEVINNALEEFMKEKRKASFLARLKSIKPTKAKMSVLEALQKARNED